jgi:NAD(P)-dependent dehydrogenase (short-subunit alcohol dehydrogenase family)
MHSGKVILITGGTGQVGAAAAAALLRRGWKEIDL